MSPAEECSLGQRGSPPPATHTNSQAWHSSTWTEVPPPLAQPSRFPQALPEKKKDGSRGLRPVVLRGLAFQVWPEGLQQSRVQLLGLIKNEQGLVAVLLQRPHLVCQLLLHRTQGTAGEPWEAQPARRALVRCPFLQGSAVDCQGLGSARGLPNSNLGCGGG